ncbi:helix-turn-helix transcriptional regulator [Isoptericola sp. NEAU-Y5]|uniref:Helix-turn-helix transcriptional regulator n=1 Tax=Isoptericola luteus TaxID=2879484 RepID=A0ABS7ZE22_9MICO|nr:helix-turn-helix transcriptional regulator [Isoptericola sp. NEAU-Y5]MCA5893288.1 helix-turn-helix transcriptional regulator [Isoptericola sp. NEAU-Y5]
MGNYDERLQARLHHLGQRVRTERGRLGLSQEDLAHRAGLHRTYVGSVERGERNISIGSLYALADELDISASALLTDPLSQSSTK